MTKGKAMNRVSEAKAVQFFNDTWSGKSGKIFYAISQKLDGLLRLSTTYRDDTAHPIGDPKEIQRAMYALCRGNIEF